MSQPLTSRGSQTQSLILQAAYTLFLERGYHGTSMRQIAQRAGISLGNIYNHFASKEEVFKRVFDDHHPYHQILPAIKTEPGESAEEFVRRSAHRMVQILNQNPDFLKLVFIELVEFEGQHLPGLYETVFSEIIAILQPFLEKAEELKPLPTLLIVRAFLGLFFSYALTEMLMGELFPEELRQGTLDGLIDIYLHGILA
jgi:AcrR family transcriptional regulator